MKWEYKTVVLWFSFDPTSPSKNREWQTEVDKQLNSFGEAGWELISGYEYPMSYSGGPNDGKTAVQVRFKRQK